MPKHFSVSYGTSWLNGETSKFRVLSTLPTPIPKPKALLLALHVGAGIRIRVLMP